MLFSLKLKSKNTQIHKFHMASPNLFEVTAIDNSCLVGNTIDMWGNAISMRRLLGKFT